MLFLRVSQQLLQPVRDLIERYKEYLLLSMLSVEPEDQALRPLIMPGLTLVGLSLTNLENEDGMQLALPFEKRSPV